MLPVAGFGNGGAETPQLGAVLDEDFAMAGEVILFESGGGEGGFGVEEAGELGDQGVSLRKEVSEQWYEGELEERTRSSKSSI